LLSNEIAGFPFTIGRDWRGLTGADLHILRSVQPVSETTKRMFPMSVSAVTAPVPIVAPETSAPKVPDAQNGAADGTRTPQPTLLAALPPGQGTRIDQLA
jgi:hypothetical protein